MKIYPLLIILAFIIMILYLVIKKQKMYEYFDGSNFNLAAGYYIPTAQAFPDKNSTTLKDCYQSCDSDSKCTGFTFVDDRCWKYNDILPTLMKARRTKPISGLKQMANCEDMQQMLGGICYPNRDYPSNDLLPAPKFVKTDNLTTCGQLCANTTGCAGISFLPVKQSCYLKGKMPGDGVNSRDRISWSM
jgi:hypothetical protein